MPWAEKIESNQIRSFKGEVERRVKKHLLNSFDPQNEIDPIGICDKHRQTIGKIENKICDPAKLPSPVGSKSIWPRCLSWLNPGIPHHNLCEKYRRENLRKLLSYDTTFQEILASDVIIEKMADSPKENTSISLLTMGTPYKIIKPSTYDSKATTHQQSWTSSK